LSDYLVRVQLLTTSLEASQTSSNPLDQSDEERNRSLEEELSSVLKENARLKETVQARDSEI
jgi:hypothetical protein